MAATKEPGSAWRPTTVRVRADIFARAQEQEIDISDTCNRALADLLGIDYRQQQLDSVPVPPPVIIAKNGAVAAEGSKVAQKPAQPPVINAEDPTAAGAIAGSKKLPVKKPAPVPPTSGAPTSDTQKSDAPTPDAPAPENKGTPTKVPAAAPAKKTSKPLPKKAAKGDGLKKFITQTIVREDGDGAVISKDELYQLFSRWCRDQKVSPVPDQKTVTVALKTKFAFREKRAGGESCWTGVRFR